MLRSLFLLPLLVMALAAPLSMNLLHDPGFDLCWVWNPYWVAEGGLDQIWCDGISLPIPTKAGEGLALQCFDRDNCHDRLYQVVDLTGYEGQSLILAFDYQVRTRGQTQFAADFCSVRLRDENGADIGLLFEANNTAPTIDWKRVAIVFRELDMGLVRVSFEADTDASGETWCAWESTAFVVPSAKIYLPFVTR